MPHRMNPGNLLDCRNGRFLTFGLPYVSEGIPFGFTSVAMVALFLPWAFKWVWAAVIDLIKLHRWVGRKARIVASTVMVVVTLLVAAMVDFKAHFQLLLVMVVPNNVFCATQDVAIDSLAVSTLLADERGRANGIMFGGPYLGIALDDGGAMFVNGTFGFEAALAGVACGFDSYHPLVFRRPALWGPLVFGAKRYGRNRALFPSATCTGYASQ